MNYGNSKIDLLNTDIRKSMVEMIKNDISKDSESNGIDNPLRTFQYLTQNSSFESKKL